MNLAVIGAFVVGAVVLAVAGVVMLGSGKMFRQTFRYMMFFEGSVKGLSVGAPVTFRGVKVGNVVDITLRADPDTLAFTIPVTIEVSKDNIERTSEISMPASEVIDRLIDKGLRAKLDMQSIITGQLLIDLELLPDTPVKLSGGQHRYPEIPTVPTAFARLARKLEDLPFDKMVEDASAALKAIQSLVSDPALPEMVRRLNQVSANLEQMTADLNRRAGPLAGSLHDLTDQADETFEHLNATIERIGQGANALAQLADGARPAVDRAGQVLTNMAEMTDPAARTRHELGTLIRELSEAARAIRTLSNYLERHPEALIRGKSGVQRR